MSEKYFNAYVDAAVGSIHEYVALTLQLKAQLRVANELLNEKSNVSTDIEERIQSVREEKDKEIIALQNNMEILKRENETRIASIVKEKEQALSAIIKDKDDKIRNLQNECDSLKLNKNNSSAGLEAELDTLRTKVLEIDHWKARTRKAEDSYNAVANKVGHMDTLTKQYSELKNQYVSLSRDYESAMSQIKELHDAAAKIEAQAATQNKSPKKVINNKSSVSKAAVIAKPKETTLDDF